MSGVRLVALAGVSGAGKDTAGSYLSGRHGFVRVAIADPVKEVMMSLFGLSREQLWGDARNVADAALGRAPRELYQQFGRACRDIDPDVWTRIFRRKVRETMEAGGSVVCTDLRMFEERRVVRELGGSVWALGRSAAGAPGNMSLDSTETEVAATRAWHVDHVIPNDGTIAELHARLDRALEGTPPVTSLCREPVSRPC